MVFEKLDWIFGYATCERVDLFIKIVFLLSYVSVKNVPRIDLEIVRKEFIT